MNNSVNYSKYEIFECSGSANITKNKYSKAKSLVVFLQNCNIKYWRPMIAMLIILTIYMK